MSHFEYLAVFVSIIVSLGLVRLLEGIPVVLIRGRRDGVHVAWVFCILLMHAQIWWVFWTYSMDVSWTYTRFLLILLPMALLYSSAVALVPREAEKIGSWRHYFENTSRRFYLLFAGFLLTVGAANWIILSPSAGSFVPVRLATAAYLVLLGVCAVTKRRWIHTVLAIVTLAVAAVSVVVLLQPGRIG